MSYKRENSMFNEGIKDFLKEPLEIKKPEEKKAIKQDLADDFLNSIDKPKEEHKILNLLDKKFNKQSNSTLKSVRLKEVDLQALSDLRNICATMGERMPSLADLIRVGALLKIKELNNR